MSALPSPVWTTIEEFDRIAAQEEERELELLEGEVLEVTFPLWTHVMVQKRLLELITSVAADRGMVLTEAPYQIAQTPRQVKRRADVAFVSAARSQAAHQAGILEGAPDLVIEVLSPSNTASQMYRLERLCLANGCQEFWTVDLDDQSIRVVRGNVTTVYQRGEAVPLPMFQSEPLSIDRVFDGIL